MSYYKTGKKTDKIQISFLKSKNLFNVLQNLEVTYEGITRQDTVNYQFDYCNCQQ